MNRELGQSILMDYLSFTVRAGTDMLERVSEALGTGKLIDNGYGGMGYISSATILDGARIYWHAQRPEMGIHVSLNASSLDLTGFSPLGMINRILDWQGKIARLDLAFDDFDNQLDMDLMYRKLQDLEVVTRFRKVKRIEGLDMIGGGKSGHTINFGLRTSKAFVRIYDKKAERQVKGKDVSEIDNWTRVEIELKGEKANVFSVLIAETAKSSAGKSVSQLCAGLLLGLLDFKEPDEHDGNKSRWASSEWWLKFVRTQEKLTLSIPKNAKTLEEIKVWINNQVATSLAMIILAENDDNGVSGYDWIMETIEEGVGRMTKPQQKRLDLYNEEKKQKQKQ